MIIVCKDPFQPRELEYHRHTGPFIDWLVTAFPEGFGVGALVLHNGRKVAVEDFDIQVSHGDEVAVVVMPAWASAVAAVVAVDWAAAAAAAAIGIGLNFAINWVFGSPTAPTAADAPQASPVYSLAVPTNQARLGQPIPVGYGSPLYVPDIAAQPYTWYESNDQYLGMVLCLGQGGYQVDSMMVADTPEEQLADDVVVWQAFGPTDHNQTIGVIDAAMGIWEDVDTSPEVSDQELVDPTIQKVAVTSINLAARTWTFYGALSPEIVVGDEVTLSSSAPNNGAYTVESIAGDRLSIVVEEAMSTTGYSTTVSSNVELRWFDPSVSELTYDDSPSPGQDWAGSDATVTLIGGLVSSLSGVVYSFDASRFRIYDAINIEDQGPVTSAQISISAATSGDAVFKRQTLVGPFVACSPDVTANVIAVDVVLPSGLYVANEDGTLGAASVSFFITIEAIDEDGATTGPSYGYDEQITRTDNTPQRITFEYALAAARYRVSMERTTGGTGKATDQSRIVWTGLKARIVYDNQPAYGETTLIGVKIKATNGLASGAHNRLGIRATRMLEGVVTTNPADAFKDIFTNTVYGGGRPLTELDTDTLDALKTAWAVHNGFNAVYDSRETVWSALQKSIQVVNAYPVVVDGQVSIVQDGPNTTVKQAFTEANMVEGSLRIAYRFDQPDDIDGYETEYRDPVSFLPKYSIYPTAAVNPEKVVLFGCTCPDADTSFARLMWQKRLYRRKSVTFDTELVGLLPAVNDRITVTHRLIDNGNSAERYIVTSITPGNGYRVSINAMIDDTRVFDGVSLALTGVSDV